MSEPTAPDPNTIYDLVYGVFKPEIVRMALTLDVFTPLANGPLEAESIAQACGCDPIGLHALLDYLVSVKALEYQAGQYTLTPSAETFLVRGRQTYAGDLILAYTDPVMWNGFVQALRTGQPSRYEEPHAQDAWLESYSRTRISKGLEMWRAVGVEGQSGLRILDVACGCAIKSFALAQTDPSIHVTCLDQPKVLEVARDLAERMNLTAQVTFAPEDLFTVDLGHDQYDIALLGQITQYLTPEQNIDLYRRVHAALSPQGTLVIDEPMIADRTAEWLNFLTLFMWCDSGGKIYLFDEYRVWLESAGFARVTQLSERWLMAIK